MPRVFHVTFTKTFEATILAPSEQALRKALKKSQHDIDSSWDPPDEWEFELFDPLKHPEKSPLPDEIPEFDMAVIAEEIRSAEEIGALGEQIKELRLKAQEELNSMHLDKVQVPLPFAEKMR